VSKEIDKLKARADKELDEILSWIPEDDKTFLRALIRCYGILNNSIGTREGWEQQREWVKQGGK